MGFLPRNFFSAGLPSNNAGWAWGEGQGVKDEAMKDEGGRVRGKGGAGREQR